MDYLNWREEYECWLGGEVAKEKRRRKRCGWFCNGVSQQARFFSATAFNCLKEDPEMANGESEPGLGVREAGKAGKIHLE